MTAYLRWTFPFDSILRYLHGDWVSVSLTLCTVSCVKCGTVLIPHILKSNPHYFYSFRGLKNQMRIIITCGLDSRSRAGFWKK